MASGTVKVTAALLVTGLLGIGGWNRATGWRPSPTIYRLQGIDLPADPPAIEWGSVRAAGADFAYLVATVGARRRDTRFEENWQALPDAGLRRGAVHLYSLCEDPAAQADAFNATVPRTADALPPAVDVDLRVSRAAERRYALSTAIDRPLWLTGNLFRPSYTPRAWRLWRASDIKRIDGVEGPVNWDVVTP